jgi:TolA-binding protein
LLRHEANQHYVLAGEYSLRHAAAAGSDPLAGDDGSASLWAAADSFDRGGRQDRALALFRQYLANHPSEDARVPETLFRSAQAHQARLEYDLAAEHYRRLTDELPRSAFAARSYVPLAQCAVALGHEDEAAVVLEDVLAGRRLLSPEAGAYRDALIELGRLRYRRGEFTPAIERLTEAADRYPADAQALEVLYLLADSYRGSVRLLDVQLAEAAALSPADRGSLVALRTEQLQAAEQLFARICDEMAAPPTGAEHSAAAGGAQHDSAAPASYRDDLVRRAHLYRGDSSWRSTTKRWSFTSVRRAAIAANKAPCTRSCKS